MGNCRITISLRKSLKTWGRSDTVLLWAWALFVAGAVTFYEIYFNNYNQHPGTSFWTDRVPSYFALTLVFTGVILAVSRLLPRLRGWEGLLVTSLAVSILFVALTAGASADSNWWFDLLVARNVLILTTVYLIPPFVLATLKHWKTAAPE
jgi:hypothetical protein